MDSFLHDLRYGFRMLFKSPGVSALAILALALGIGANIAIFSFVDALYYRPLPVAHPEGLVAIYTSCQLPHGYSPRCGDSNPDLQDIKAQAQSLQDVVFYERRGAVLIENGDATHLGVNLVSDNWMEVMGIQAAVGRIFTVAEQAQPGTPAEAMLSYSFWKRHYGSDRSVIGKTLTFTGRQWTVIGVLPEGYRGTEAILDPELTVPMSSWNRLFQYNDRRLADREYRFYDAYGRLRDGATLASLNAELATVASRLAQAYPKSNTNRQITAVAERDSHGGLKDISRLLLALAGLVLLIACANVANLLLARGESRRKEVATRMAIGASRWRVAGQFLIESAILSLFAGGMALLFGNWTIGSIPALLAGMPVPISIDARLDFRAVVFAAGTAIAAVFLFGLVPAVSASRTNLIGVLKSQTGTGDEAKGRTWLRDGMVIGQMAISLMLILSTGLLLRSLLKMQAVDPGFATYRPMLFADVLAPDRKEVTALQQFRVMQQELAALPGVQSVAFASRIPMGPSGGGHADEVMVPGKLQPDGRGISIKSSYVSRGYLETMGTQLLRGRIFDASDDAESKGVVVINQAMARKFWGDEDAIGKHFKIGRADGRQAGKDIEVIGVVQDGKYNSIIEQPDPYLFLNMSQFRDGNATFIVATSTDPAMLATPVRQQMRDRYGMTVLEVVTLHDFMRFQTFAGRLAAQLVGFMCGLGIFLAAMGLYGVVSYLVGRRTHEIGIRMALGAPAQAILHLFMSRGVMLAGIGIAIGVAAALALSSLAGSMLYGVSNRDPLTFVLGSLLLLLIAAAATYLPARRATRVEPMEALRYE